MNSKYLNSLIISVLVAMLAYAAAIFAVDAQQVSAAVNLLGIEGWSAILVLSIVNYGLRFIRWDYYLRILGHDVAWLKGCQIYMAGFALTTTPAKAGEVIRSLYLKPIGVQFNQSLGAMLVERLVDVISLLLMSMIAVVLLSTLELPVVIILAIVLLALFALHDERLRRALSNGASKVPFKKLQSFVLHVNSVVATSSMLLHPRRLGLGLIIGLVAWVAEGYGLWLVLHWLGADISLFLGVGIYAAALLVGALSFIPGGLGATEASMVAMLSIAGMDPASAVAASLICRVATLWFAVVIGIGSVATLPAKNLWRGGFGREVDVE